MEEPEIMVHVRLSKDLVKEVDHLGIDWDKYRAASFERLLRLGLGVVEMAESKDAEPEELIAAPSH